MEANGSEKAFCVLTFHECRTVTIVQRQFRIYRAPVRYVTESWSVVLLLNKKIHILLSQVYCVWQVVKTQTIISNNPVYLQVYPMLSFVLHIHSLVKNICDYKIKEIVIIRFPTSRMNSIYLLNSEMKSGASVEPEVSLVVPVILYSVQ
jgi:hypothetical protein